MADNKVAIRVKRNNQTYCFLVDTSDTVASVKQKIVEAANQHSGEDAANKISTELIRILKDETVLDDSQSMQEAEINENSNLFVVLKIADDEWEAVDVQSTEMDEGSASG